MSASSLPENAVAIVGLAGHFPGASDVRTFWRNLCDGKECTRTFTDEELRAAGIPEEMFRRADYVRTRAPLDRPEYFDADFFGFTPREAEITDPQHRVFLECAWTALEDAGLDPSRYSGSIGVWAGSSLNTYLLHNLGSDRTRMAEFVAQYQADGYSLLIGNDKDYLASRVAYKLDLRGPAMAVQTACSTSLVAVVQAVNALLAYQCDAALAGGVSISFPQERGYRYQEDAIASADGHTRAFDAQSSGTVFGAGCGVVVLKRLADALTDRDHIYAIVRGAAVNNDGSKKVSFFAPSVTGQAEVVALAQALAEVGADTVDYVEAHGTATPLGDPIEVAALTQAFRASTDARETCLLGTAKTNIGHLECAAGVAGLIKTALALEHGIIPPSLHFTAPNPKIDFASSPFQVVQELTAWPAREHPRRAGVSSFGIGGTNAHVVLEQAPTTASPARSRNPQLLVLSARSLRALEDATTALGDWLKDHPEASLADVAFTLQVGRRHFPHRRFVVATSIEEAARLLRRRDRHHVYSSTPKPEPPSEMDAPTALGFRWLSGETPTAEEWSAAQASDARRIPLPTYPFQRERYWIEPKPLTVSAEPPATPSPAPLPGTPLDALKAELSTLSGLDLRTATEATTLLDLGFDSLFLTQVAVNLQKRFGVKLRFRQLMEELATLGALADYCASGKSATATPAKVAPLPATVPDLKPTAFGPFRPAQVDASAALSPAQQAHLDALIERTVRKTAESKRRTERDRKYFADPRSVAGFRPYWKEMVYPIVTVRSAGARFWDVDGNEYIDLTMGFGTNLIGHAPAFITQAIQDQLAQGIEVGPQSPIAGEVAALMCELTGHERAAFCNTGSEAVLAAVRIARTVTGRTRIATAGGYHGVCDEVLVRASVANGVRRTVPIAPGIPDHVAREVLVLDYGAPESIELLREQAHDLAAVLIEPVQSRHPDLQPREFLQAVREITTQSETALVFDEVINGFRCHLNGAQAHFGIRSDIGTWGKIIGGGMPIGAVTGSALYMDALDGGDWQYGDASFPGAGVTFFAGTYVRHPLAMAASRAMLSYLKEQGPQLQARLNERTTEFITHLNRWLVEQEVPLHLEHFSSLFYLHFAPEVKYGSLLYFHLREKGLHIWEGRPSFLSTAHTDDDIAEIIRIFKESVLEMQAVGFLPRARSTDAPTNAALEVHVPTVPLSDWQRGLWATCQLGGKGKRAYNEGTTLELTGPLDFEALRQALQQIVDRHEALRTAIQPDGESLVIHEKVPMPVEFEDFSQADAAAIEARFLEYEQTEFDLAQPPILKALVIKAADDRHLLALLYHHTLGNGPSYWVLFEELVALYGAAVRKESLALEPPLQLREYLRWQAERANSEEARHDEAYWLDQLGGGLPTLELPEDRARPAMRTFGGDRRVMDLDETLTRALRETSAREGCSLFMILFSAFQVWLGRLAGQDDVVIGVPADSSVRELPGGQKLFANTTNMLPMRARLAHEQPFVELLRTTKRQVLSAADHQEYFFGHLLKRLGVPFDLSRPAVFSVSFNYESGKFLQETEGLRFELITEGVPYRSARDISPFDLVINIAEKDGRLHLECDLNADIFEGRTVERWLGHYRTLLEAIVAEPNREIGRLPLLNAAERQEMLVEWNATASDYPMEPVHEWIENQAHNTPAAVAVICGEHSLTYGELLARAARLTAHLQQLGVKRGQFIGVALGRCVEMAVAVLGVLKAGCAYVPLDPNFPSARLSMMIEDAQVPVIVTRSDVDGLPETSAALVSLDQLADGPPAAPVPVSPSDCSYVLFTSGTTGRPKGVEVPHRGLSNLFNYLQRTPGITRDDTLLAVTTLSFDIATLEVLLPLTVGAKVCIASQVTAADAYELAKEIEASGATILQATPATWRSLVASGWPGAKGLKIITGGEPLPADLAAALLERTAEVWNLYGPTETTIYSTGSRILSAEPPITIGSPVANTQAYILNSSLEPQPIGIVGELHLGGAGLARGYVGRPEQTAERFIADPFAADGSLMYKTGDLGRWLPDGRIVCLGRVDQQIKLRGFRIERSEIELALRAHGKVENSAVVLRESRSGEPRLVAFYTCASASAPSEVELRNHLADRLPPYMVPATFVRLEKFPLTPSGKIDVKSLPETEAGGIETRDIVAAQTPLEAELVALWEELLERKPIGTTDSFFDLGGHSLLAVRLLSRVAGRWNARIPMSELFSSPTVAALARSIDASANASTKTGAASIPIARRNRREAAPTP